jgi:hypothetical protein
MPEKAITTSATTATTSSPLSSSNLLSQIQSMLPPTQTNTFSNNDPVSQIIGQV